jgi:hypothetical protein
VLRAKLPHERPAETPYLPDELDLFEASSRNEGQDALFVVSFGGLQDAVLIGGGHDLGLRVLASLLQEDVVRSEV